MISGPQLLLAPLAAAVIGAMDSLPVSFVASLAIGVFQQVVYWSYLQSATTDMALFAAVSTYLLNSAYFPSLVPPVVGRPSLFGRVSLASPQAFYWFCLAVLAVVLLAAWQFRRSRTGRVCVAVRDNERAAAAYGVSPRRARLAAFAFSGALCGLAGGLYVLALRGVGFSGFDPEKSVVVFTMVVVGGLGSLPGALIGAVYVESAVPRAGHQWRRQVDAPQGGGRRVVGPPRPSGARRCRHHHARPGSPGAGRDRETGAALVIIEHDIGLVRSMADRLLCMHLGQVIAEGASEDVLGDPAVVSSYLGSDPVAIARSGRVVSGAGPVGRATPGTGST